MKIEILIQNGKTVICTDGLPVAEILPCDGAVDRFEAIEDGVWLWKRQTETPVDKMRMEVVLLGEPDFTMIPGISYNGNGWGTTP